MGGRDFVRYPFPMSADRIRLVCELARRHCMARLECRHCEHYVVLSPAILEKMVDGLESISNVEKRLRCTRCCGKGAKVAIVYPRGRCPPPFPLPFGERESCEAAG
jgi:hypothetical protein